MIGIVTLTNVTEMLSECGPLFLKRMLMALFPLSTKDASRFVSRLKVVAEWTEFQLGPNSHGKILTTTFSKQFSGTLRSPINSSHRDLSKLRL